MKLNTGSPMEVSRATLASPPSSSPRMEKSKGFLLLFTSSATGQFLPTSILLLSCRDTDRSIRRHLQYRWKNSQSSFYRMLISRSRKVDRSLSRRHQVERTTSSRCDVYSKRTRLDSEFANVFLVTELKLILHSFVPSDLPNLLSWIQRA